MKFQTKNPPKLSWIWSKNSISETDIFIVYANYSYIPILFLNLIGNVKSTTKSELETHSRKHIHGNTFGNTFVETHSNFEFCHLKMKQKSF